jgi:nicotinamidase-related amidase
LQPLKPIRDDFAVLKPRHSAFYGTPLEFLLEELKIERLVLTGIVIDMCVFATAQDAHVRKLSLWVPADCVAGFTGAQERSALSLIARTLDADIRPAIRRSR